MTSLNHKKFLRTTIREWNKDGKLIETPVIDINLEIVNMKSALHFLHGVQYQGGNVKFNDNIMTSSGKIGGDMCENNDLQSGGYSHLNNLLNPEYFKDLENKSATNNTDKSAGISITDDNVLMDERVNCDILSSLLVN